MSPAPDPTTVGMGFIRDPRTWAVLAVIALPLGTMAWFLAI